MDDQMSLLTKHNKALVARLMAKETIKLLTDTARLMDDESPLDRPTAILFIAEFLLLVFKDVVTDRPLEMNGESLSKHVSKSFNDAKQDLEAKISAVFTSIMKKYSTKSEIYTCEISPIDPKKPGMEN